MIKIFQSLLVLGILLYDISEGCGRVPATPPQPSSTPVPTQQPSSNETIRGEECTEEERNTTLCVTGQGECFVYIIAFKRKPSCHCTTNYMGPQCAELNVEILFPSTDDGVATAGIAASVAVAVVVAVVFIGVLIVYYRRKRKRERKPPKPPVNGKPLLPENHTVSDVSSDILQQPRTDMQFNSNGNYFLCEEKKQMIEYRTTSV